MLTEAGLALPARLQLCDALLQAGAAAHPLPALHANPAAGSGKTAPAPTAGRVTAARRQQWEDRRGLAHRSPSEHW